MNIKNYLSILAVLVLFISCGEDDNTPDAIPFRDRGEQSIADDAFIREYLETHFYNYEEFANPPADFDYEIRFDTISGENADKTPLINQVVSKTYDRFEASNTLYILTAREGVGPATTQVDSTFVTYRGENILSNVFDSASNPIWFNLPATIDGFANGIEGARGGSGFTIAPDGTTEFNNDYGIGAIFIPSGLAYFAQPPNSDIGIYSSLVFTFSMYDSKVTDHDGDGILTINEDIDGNGFLFDDIDNTDDDTQANFNDPDDDNDGVTTRLEIVRDDEGNFVAFIDTDNDGVVDHLDTDDDGDGIDTVDEININFNTGEITYPDTDGDGTPDYLDSDS
ncbi:hypothetical protein GCM10011344_33610 [Dokdonia pacifica]|uniref:Uncharacterized protein n=1 Tax=Dokdonia pacifica TaxID=1627892 RepID=A0A239BEB3_9FLAO|nr:hypothetical protein [Dokdonia pacifica]GGG30009.1 hypothetical protein GCM10011344_33610 [Dokdonia pacifica]SNS05962.1 hypothetical protein SAMN06265376_10697 [Dokdonia pacifica]